MMRKLIQAYIQDQALPRTARLVQQIATGGLDPTNPGLEAVYQRIFERDLAQIGVENKFYPVGNAANYGLLYFLLRVARETKLSSVLELGAGQTSLLFDELRRHGLITGSVLTIEHDPIWADYVRARVSHEVRVVTLRHYEDDGLSYDGYDFDAAQLDATIDLLVVDGPPALTPKQRYTRHCCLTLLGKLNPAGFIIVIDDAERRGETLLRDRIAQELQSADIAFTRGRVVANKRQSIFASGQFSHVAFY
ncbi:class I SAM-dependent methyltransferase [Microvirga sp. VF16]|uniref:class I SAM-dependent methyltransferase n=1 Tax=Microvirga sp. VF16 TaxID=2807101 RepID=UPI00193DD3E2|nr:class I SAM-dependent methyltransferase [Microvirga sp. VF16]QRM33414.1 class I SAM-dependent methyltransferase [Microvirga sp. VF16]